MITRTGMSIGEWFRELFGIKTPVERLREYRHQIEHTVREIENENRNLDRMERKLRQEFESAAKKQNIEMARIKARNVVRLKSQQLTLANVVGRLQDIIVKTHVIGSQLVVTGSIKKITNVLKQIDKKLSLTAFNKIAIEFQKQCDIMEVKEEAVDDAMDNAFDSEGNEEENTNEMVDKMLLGVGLDTKNEMPTIIVEKSDSSLKVDLPISEKPQHELPSSSSSSSSPFPALPSSKHGPNVNNNADLPPVPKPDDGGYKSLADRLANLKKSNF